MKSNLFEFSAAQLRSALRHSTEIAHLGTRLRLEWAAHPASPYFIERLAYFRGARIAKENDEPMDHHVAYGRCFNAKPEGSRYWLDGGAAMRFEAAYREVTATIANAAPFHAQRPLRHELRAQGDPTPAPIRAMDRARAARAKCYSQEEASIEAQRVLAAEGMFPLEPLPIMFEAPRLRADADWMIGALDRFREGLAEAIDALDAAREFLARCQHAFKIAKCGVRGKVRDLQR